MEAFFCTGTKESFGFCFNGFENADVYDSGMVFYNVLFLDDELFTLHLSLFAFFFLSLFQSKVLMSILSLLCWRALEGFVLLRTFVTDFICSCVQEMNKNYKKKQTKNNPTTWI